MVQVDVFWAYGLGASLAIAAGPQLAREEKPFEGKYFSSLLLFLSIFWAPCGVLLVLRHPSWQTMQLAPDLSSISEWLIVAFGITNITQGILGYWLTIKLLKAGKERLARFNWIIGYFGMCFILLYGWDGLGYDRFLYDRDMLPGHPAWVPGVATESGAMSALFALFTKSSVGWTLFIESLYMFPPLVFLIKRGKREAGLYLSDQERLPVSVLGAHMFGVFGVGLGGAAFTALLVRKIAYLLGVGDHIERAKGLIPASTELHVLSYLIGIPLGISVLCWVVLRKDSFGDRMLRPLSLREKLR
jgi:hypothetical protein